MSTVNWYEHPQFVKDSVRKLSEAEAVYALKEAWKELYGEFPKTDSLALLFAQSALETGRWKEIHNNNFGNIKKVHKSRYRKDDGHKFTMFATGENLWNPKKKKSEWHWFEPPHTQTHFRSYDTIVEGAKDYISLISKRERYKKAWQEVLNGDPAAFSHELKVGGYYTANEEKYTLGVVKLTNEFKRRKAEFDAWKPPTPKPEETIIIFEEADEITPFPPPPAIPKDFKKLIKKSKPKKLNNSLIVNNNLNTKPNKQVDKSKAAIIGAAIVSAIGVIFSILKSCF